MWAAWFAALTAMLAVAVTEFRGGVVEVVGVLLMFSIVLMLLDRSHSTAALIATGYCACCVIIGCMVIDGAFDAIIISDKAPFGSISGIRRQLSAREVAYVYYHTMLNNLLVNATVLFCCAYLVLAALAMGLRSELRHRPHWRVITPLSLCANSAYAGVIVPRYYQLRRETAFDPAYFDWWEAVAAARIFSLVSIVTGMLVAYPVLCDVAATTLRKRE